MIIVCTRIDSYLGLKMQMDGDRWSAFLASFIEGRSKDPFRRDSLRRGSFLIHNVSFATRVTRVP